MTSPNYTIPSDESYAKLKALLKTGRWQEEFLSGLASGANRAFTTPNAPIGVSTQCLESATEVLQDFLNKYPHVSANDGSQLNIGKLNGLGFGVGALHHNCKDSPAR